MRVYPLAPGRVLAIDPCSAGFGFAILEEPARLIDWGVKNCARRRGRARTSKHSRYERALASLVRRYEPSLVVVRREVDGPRSQRSIVALLEALSIDRDFGFVIVSGDDVRLAFGRTGARTKDEIALILSKQYPALLPLPRPRDIYRPEDYRMNIYDAVAIALVAGQATRPVTIRSP